jgi:hypothetical protein
MPERTTRKRQRVGPAPEVEDDHDGKKQRGRPRVEGQAETAADVSDLDYLLSTFWMLESSKARGYSDQRN